MREQATILSRWAINKSRFWLAGLCLVCLTTFSLFADVVHLKNGRVLRGEVVEEDGDYLVIRVPYGKIKIKKEKIEFIERQSKLQYKLDLGQDLLLQKRFDRAIPAIEKVYLENARDTTARNALVYAYKRYSKHLLAVNRFEEAERVVKKLRALKPGSIGKLLENVNQKRGNLDELVTKGRAALASNDNDLAIQHFSEALKYSPDARGLITNDLGTCLVNRAVGAYKKHQFESANRDLENAFGLNPALAERYEDFYAYCSIKKILDTIQMGRIDVARSEFSQVLKFAPTNKRVLFYAGQLEEQLENYRTAAKLYGRALNKRVDNLSPQRISLLRKELEKNIGGIRKQPQLTVESTDLAIYSKSKPGAFEKIQSDNFIIYHHNDKLANKVGHVLEAHIDRIQNELGLSVDWSKERPKVFLYRTQKEYTRTTSQPEWTGGASKFLHKTGVGLLRKEIHTWQTSPKLFKSVIPHELAHLVVNENLSDYDNIPRAVHEGISILMEPEFRQNYFLSFLRLRLKSKEFIPLDALLSMRDYPSDQEFFYAEGFGLLSYLLKTTPRKKVMGVLFENPQGLSFEKRLLKLTRKKSLLELEDDWRKWLTKGKF